MDVVLKNMKEKLNLTNFVITCWKIHAAPGSNYNQLQGVFKIESFTATAKTQS